MVTGLAKVNGLLVGVVANVQGLLMNYPEYKQNSVGIGGKLYRQGLDQDERVRNPVRT